MNDGNRDVQPSAPYCCDECASTKGCVGFTFVTGNGQCWLKSAINTPSGDGSVVSGTPNHTVMNDLIKNYDNMVPQKRSVNATGVCAGDRDMCGNLTEAQCKSVDWKSPSAGGWSKYVLPMAQYGPIIATEHGSFDCSSAFEVALTSWMAKFGVSYTAWALWPQNSGGPGQGACGYPSVMYPSDSQSDGFGKGARNCETPTNCVAFLKPLGWSGVVIYEDIQKD